jgi:hypothetical protein
MLAQPIERRLEMYRIFKGVRSWLSAFVALPRLPDPLDQMSPAELADLPVSHPRFDA